MFKCLYCHNPDTIPLEGGKPYEIEYIVEHTVDMKGYFGKKGGITFSGGEPLIHSKTLVPLFKRLKEEGIHITVDTNGQVFNAHTRILLEEYTDLVMLDIKSMDPDIHEELTGKHLAAPLHFAEHRESSGKPMWLRYVLVPGWTDNPKHLHALGLHFKKFKTIERVELLPYHKLGEHKWAEMGWENKLADTPENTKEQIEAARSILAEYFELVVVK